MIITVTKCNHDTSDKYSPSKFTKLNIMKFSHTILINHIYPTIGKNNYPVKSYPFYEFLTIISWVVLNSLYSHFKGGWKCHFIDNYNVMVM